MPLPSLREMVDALVATPSVSAVVEEHDMANRAVIDLLATWLDDSGFTVEVLPLPGDARKANIIATRGPANVAGGLVLSGHTDTVPFDEGKWNSDPFRVSERDGRLFGLGTADMKSFLAVAITAAARFDTAQLTAPLTIVGTADEECGMDGARALAATWRPVARAAVIGEPTGLRPIRMHKGITMERLRLEGRSGHSSDPGLGVSALEGMRVALNAMDTFRRQLVASDARADFYPPTATLNLGNIHGGDNPNRICAHCELQYDLRTLPGMDADGLREQLRSEVVRRLSEHGLSALGLVMEPLHPGVPAFETAAHAELVRVAERLTGVDAGAVSFGTEAPFLTALGLETIVLGPGDIAVAHQPNEYVEEAALHRAVDLVEAMIAHYAGAA